MFLGELLTLINLEIESETSEGFSRSNEISRVKTFFGEIIFKFSSISLFNMCIHYEK